MQKFRRPNFAIFAGAGENERFLSNRQVELQFMVEGEVRGSHSGNATMNVRVF
jgi:hypothetical protein